jgi:hypothetical protein
MRDDVLEKPKAKKTEGDSLPGCIYGELKDALLAQGIRTEEQFFALTYDQIRRYFVGANAERIFATREYFKRPVSRPYGNY